jgi:hypothetical protein
MLDREEQSDTPDLVEDPSQALKPCWLCKTEIPYSKGFCQPCWGDLTPNQKTLISIAVVENEPLRGSIFLALVDYIRHLRRPPPTPKRQLLAQLEITI